MPRSTQRSSTSWFCIPSSLASSYSRIFCGKWSASFGTYGGHPNGASARIVGVAHSSRPGRVRPKALRTCSETRLNRRETARFVASQSPGLRRAHATRDRTPYDEQPCRNTRDYHDTTRPHARSKLRSRAANHRRRRDAGALKCQRESDSRHRFEWGRPSAHGAPSTAATTSAPSPPVDGTSAASTRAASASFSAPSEPRDHSWAEIEGPPSAGCQTC